MLTSYGDLVALFADLPLTVSDSGSDSAQLSVPYAALRHLQRQLGDEPLVADPEMLRSLLELCAIADPCLFHVMFLHHCMTIGNALDQGASEADVTALASGRWIGAALMTELGHGNSSAGIRTEAVYDDDAREFVLHTPTRDAVKHPASVGLDGIARLGIVSARLIVHGVDRGTALFLVALRDEAGPCPGVTITPRSRTPLLPMDYAAVELVGVRVPYSRWLSDGASIAEDGIFQDPLDGPDARSRRSVAMSRFAWGAVTVALAAVARASAVLALTHARQRRTFDRLAGEVTALEHLNQQRLLFGALASALAATVVARQVTQRCWHIPMGGGRGSGPSAPMMRELALAKVTVDVLADGAVDRCRSACGALGFFEENRLIGYQALTMAFQSGGGDNRLILLDGAWVMATSQDCLPDADAAPDEWVRRFRERERLLHAELVAAISGDVDGAVPFAVWNAQTELAQRFAEAHTTRTTVEALHEEWFGPAAAGASRPLLGDLYRLHCLEQVSAHAGWYLAHGLLTSQEVLALPSSINEICGRLVGNVDPLVELADVPERLRAGTNTLLAGADWASAGRQRMPT